MPEHVVETAAVEPALGAAHDAVQRFAGTSGLELAGPRWEVYGHPDGDRAPEVEIFYLLR